MAEFEKMDEVFREKMGDGEAGVPADSWQSIQSKFAAQSVAQKKSRRYLLLPISMLWIATGFFAGTILTGLGFYVYGLQKENQELKTLIHQYRAEVKEGNRITGRGVGREQDGINYEHQVHSTGRATSLRVESGRSQNNEASIFDPFEKSAESSKGAKGNRILVTKYRTPRHGQGGVQASELKERLLLGEEKSNRDAGTLNPKRNQESQELNGNNSNLKSGIQQKDSLKTAPADSLPLKEKEAKETAKPKEKKVPKIFGLPIAVGMYVSPEIASRSIHFTGEEDPELLKYKQNDKAKFGFSAGLSLDLELPKNFYLRTGINYWNLGDRNSTVMSNSKFDTSYSVQHVRVPSDVKMDSLPSGSTLIPAFDGSKMLSITSTEITESFSGFSSTVSNNYHYIGVPVLLGMKLGRSKVSAGIYSGFIANVLLSPNKSVYYIYYDPENPEKYVQAERELSRVTFAYWGGIDVDIKLSDNWSMNVSPSIKYSLSSLYKDTDAFRQLPYSLGLQVGCKYRFGKGK